MDQGRAGRDRGWVESSAVLDDHRQQVFSMFSSCGWKDTPLVWKHHFDMGYRLFCPQIFFDRFTKEVPPRGACLLYRLVELVGGIRLGSGLFVCCCAGGSVWPIISLGLGGWCP